MRESVASRNKDYIIQAIRSGRYLKDLAAELGVATPSLCEPMRRYPDYLEALRLSDRDRVTARLSPQVAHERKALKLAVLIYFLRWGNDNWLVEQGLAAPTRYKLSTLARRNTELLRGLAKSK